VVTRAGFYFPMLATATKSKAPDWTDVMVRLTGLRLAIYDELLTRGSVSVDGLAVNLRPGQRVLEQLAEALAWLTTHRMVRTAGGIWHAVPMATAQKLFTEHGPVAVPGYTYNGGDSLAAKKGTATARSQGDMTAPAEVAAVVPLSPAPERRAVHGSAFLDFGDSKPFTPA
jgi:hypothetical protein